MPRAMSVDEARAFLMDGTRTGKVGVVRKDGRPYVAPIWFVLDGGDLVFTTFAKTVKGHALRRDPRTTLIVDDERPPFAWVRVEGEATLSADPEELRRFATVIGARYMGDDRAAEFGERNAVDGELLVRVRISRLTGESDVSGY